MFRAIFLIILLVYSLLPLKAQIYDNGIGLRIGETQGVVFKHFINQPTAIEANISFFRGGINAYLLGEYHIYGVVPGENLSVYVGGGLHAAYVDGTKIPGWYPDDPGFSYQSLAGIDLIVGAEYSFDEFPFCIGLDVKPALNILGNLHYWQGWGISVKYIFISSQPLQ